MVTCSSELFLMNIMEDETFRGNFPQKIVQRDLYVTIKTINSRLNSNLSVGLDLLIKPDTHADELDLACL